MDPGSTDSYRLAFDGRLLRRGFWLYVWRIICPEGSELYCVGRTGDSSSPNAASPFSRMSAHFSRNPRGNALLRNLLSEGIAADECQFELHAHGPFFPEQESFDAHRPCRDHMAALEKDVADQLRQAGRRVIGTHPSTPGSKEEVGAEARKIVESVCAR